MTKKLELKVLIVVYLFLNNTIAFGLENTNIGTRATAMSGNYHSIADDWSAMYWNPAGLSFIEGWNAGFSLEYVVLRSTFMPGNGSYSFGGNQNYQPFSATYSVTRDAEPMNFLVPSFGISYNSGGKSAFGLGMWVPYGLGTKWDLLDTDGNSNGRGVYNSLYPKYEYENNMKVIDLHPTVSYKISEKLSFGAGLSILFGEVGIRRPAYLQNLYLYDEKLYNTLLSISDDSQAETLDQMRLSPYDHLIAEVEMKGSDISVGGNFGLMYKPSKTISIGASIQMNQDLEVSGNYKQTAYFADNEDFNSLNQYYDEEIFSILHRNGLLEEQDYLVISKFYSGELLSIEDTKASTKIPLPINAGMGISYMGIKDLTLSVDVNFIQWSDWDTLSVNNESSERISELVMNWKNTFKIGSGAEYQSKIATFRAGFSLDHRAAVDETISPAIPEIGNRCNLNLGVGFKMLGGQLSLNYGKVIIANHTVDSWIYDDMNVAQNMPGTYTMNVNSVMVGYDYKF